VAKVLFEVFVLIWGFYIIEDRFGGILFGRKDNSGFEEARRDMREVRIDV